MNENENENQMNPLAEVAVKAITLFCAVSSVKSQAKIADPVMAKGFEPLLEVVNQLAEADPECDYTDLFVLVKTCEMEINEALIARGLFVTKTESQEGED
jgi:hypothetical protein